KSYVYSSYLELIMPYEYHEAAVLCLTFFNPKTPHSTLHPRNQEMLLDPAYPQKLWRCNRKGK
ncbi:TPA: hypothetical protein MII19_27005, partial [Klebsiella pneumoniae]|nr:hypothetical protein [Klebsiella pneumoniae]HBX5136066.1 hypothetical protein [Klebsiella pneumoniae]HBX8460863.1 hypothetical protein [Klebsiella pneumoniae]HBX8482900.1 hypothetical protein [Klebsiella pneumoniae]HBX8488344.1 hypothetical protein [Klebsiella pneumoniae]